MTPFHPSEVGDLHTARFTLPVPDEVRRFWPYSTGYFLTDLCEIGEWTRRRELAHGL